MAWWPRRHRHRQDQDLQVIAEQLSAAGVPVVMADFRVTFRACHGPSRVERQDRPTGHRHRRRLGGPNPFPVEFLSLGTGGIGIRCERRSPRSVRSCSQSPGAQPESGIHPRSDLPLRRSAGPAAVGSEGSSVGDHLLTRPTRARPSSRCWVRCPQTAGVILRALVNLEAEGGDTFFGEPEIEPADLLRVNDQGKGIITLFEVGEQAARPVMRFPHS